jgi:3(or 17)beta-hydroxysteroid dehydrogenase
VSRFDGKVAMVTGAAAGLGKAIAERLAWEGAQVITTDLQDDVGRAAAAQNGSLFIEQDVRDEGRWHEVIGEICERFGRLDCLVNNAGIVGPAENVTPGDTRLVDWRRVFAVNVESVLIGCQAAIPVMHRTGGGAIANISSIAGLLATPYATAYGASKAAVTQLTKSIAQYCAQQELNIRCNSVHPGTVRTALWEKIARQDAAKRGIAFEDFVAQKERRNPLRTLTSPQDVAATVAFLLSDDAHHITGTQIVVDGGMTGCDTFEADIAQNSPRQTLDKI